MRTGSCKYNVTCKFHHPQPATVGVVPMSGSSIYAAPGPSSPAPQPYQGLPTWPIARTPYMPSPRIQGPSNYGAMILPAQGLVGLPAGWSTYQVRKYSWAKFLLPRCFSILSLAIVVGFSAPRGLFRPRT